MQRYQHGNSIPETELKRSQAAFEAAGVIFIEENGEGPGVRMRKQKPKPTEGLMPGHIEGPDEADRLP